MPTVTQDALLRLRMSGAQAAQNALKQLTLMLTQLQSTAASPIDLAGINKALSSIRGLANAGMGGGHGGRRGGLFDNTFSDNVENLTFAIAGYQALNVPEMMRRTFDSFRDSARVETTSEAFKHLSDTLRQDVAGSMSTVRSATHGMVDDMTLMRGMLTLQGSGIQITAEQYGVLANQVIRLGAAIHGIPPAEAIKRLSTGITKLSEDVLEETGLVGVLTSALRKYEAQTGLNADSLTRQQKQQLALNEAMVQAQEKVAVLGEEHSKFTSELARAQASAQNMLDTLAKYPAALAGAKNGLAIGADVAGTVAGFGAERAIRRGGGKAIGIAKSLAGLAGTALAAGGVAGAVAAGVSLAAAGGLYAYNHFAGGPSTSPSASASAGAQVSVSNTITIQNGGSSPAARQTAREVEEFLLRSASVQLPNPRGLPGGGN